MRYTIRQIMNHSRYLLIAAGLFAFTTAHGFNCKQIRQFTELYLKLHYSAEAFDDSVSEATLDNFLKSLDPAKMYFLKEDIDGFEATYAYELDNAVKNTDCDALNTILQIYSKRFKARQPVIQTLIAGEHDFTIDEYYDVDRKKRTYAETEEELSERWRKQIKLELLRSKKRFDDIEKAQEKLKKKYELSSKYLYELDTMELASIFLNAYSTSLDPHTKYLSPEVLEDFHISTGLSLEGIGAVLRSEYGLTTVQSLVPGGPAQKGDELKEGDTIIAVGQNDEEPIDVVDMKLRDVVKHIRGKRNTEVRLTIEREEKDKMTHHIVSIIRDKIELTDREARGYSYEVNVEVPEQTTPEHYRIGFIQLPSFYTDFEARKQGKEDYKSSSKDVEKLISSLKEEGIDGLVLDLRFNSGGSLDEAINLAGLFIKTGPVVQVKNTNGTTQVLSDEDPAIAYDGPLIVMINRQSASSSEILAGAIKDHGRGIIIGDSHSFGKGTVQTVKDIASGKFGAIKVTISQFFRPGGKSTQLKGVESDIVLPDLVDQLELGEKFYDRHLPWNKIESAEFTPQNRIAPYLESLLTESSKRIAEDVDFQKIQEEIDEYHEKEATRTQISLKEEVDEEADTNEDEDETAVAENETEADEGTNDENNKRIELDKDIMLRETLAITADYLQLLKDAPSGIISFPELTEAVIAERDETPEAIDISAE